MICQIEHLSSDSDVGMLRLCYRGVVTDWPCSVEDLVALWEL
jgi:hypothetical protein